MLMISKIVINESKSQPAAGCLSFLPDDLIYSASVLFFPFVCFFYCFPAFQRYELAAKEHNQMDYQTSKYLHIALK
ncbi:MAG: hypothetical protein RIS29_1750 [Bacteroidota bacterium]